MHILRRNPESDGWWVSFWKGRMGQGSLVGPFFPLGLESCPALAIRLHMAQMYVYRIGIVALFNLPLLQSSQLKHGPDMGRVFVVRLRCAARRTRLPTYLLRPFPSLLPYFPYGGNAWFWENRWARRVHSFLGRLPPNLGSRSILAWFMGRLVLVPCGGRQPTKHCRGPSAAPESVGFCKS